MSVRWLLVGALLVAGCSTGLEPGDDTGPGDTDSGDTGDTDTGSDTGTDTDTGSTDTDTDTGSTDTDTGSTDTDTGTTGCVDDGNEQDDTLETANPVAATSSTPGQVCAADSDWYAVPVGPGCLVDLLVDFSVAVGDLDVILYDADGYAVGLGLSETDDEVLSYIHGGAASTLYVEVYGYQDAEAPYTLTVTSTCDAAPACPTDDLFEQDDTLETAFPLNLIHTDVLAVTCADDEDWYVVPWVPAGCRVDAALDFDPQAADLDLYVFDSTELLAGSSASVHATEAALWYADIDGPVYVAVDGYGAATGPYTLTTDVYCPDYETPTCPDDDWFEDNDLDYEAALLNDGYTAVDAAMCDAMDRYWAPIPAGCFYQARIDFDDAAMDLDLDLYDYVTDAVLTGSYSTSAPEWISWIADADVYGEIGVLPYSGQGAYSLQALLVCPDGAPLACPGDDIYEDNEATSMPLNPTDTFVEAIACAGDSDFFAAWVPAGCTFDAFLAHGAGGDLDLYFWDGATEIDSSLNEPPVDEEQLSYTATADLWVDLEVYPYSGSAEYLLETSVTCP